MLSAGDRNKMIMLCNGLFSTVVSEMRERHPFIEIKHAVLALLV